MAQTEKEISYTDIIFGIKTLKAIVVRSRKKIIVVGLVFGLLGGMYAWITPKMYLAELSFATEDKGSAGNMASIIGQLGIDIGKDGGAFKGDNIVDLLTSQSIIENALLAEVEISGKKELLVNYYLSNFSTEVNDPLFKYRQPREDFSRYQDSILHLVSFGLKRDAISVEKKDKKRSFFMLRVVAPDELFAVLLCKSLTKTVYEMYVDIKTQKAKQTVALLEYRRDSVMVELDKQLYEAAGSQDKNMNSVISKVKIPYLKSQLRVQMLTTMYGELTKNLELSKMNLAREEPLVQIIDTPIPPLKVEKRSIIITGIIFAIFGVVLVMSIIVGRIFYKSLAENRLFMEVYNEEC
jgi:hypothetical protein